MHCNLDRGIVHWDLGRGNRPCGLSKLFLPYGFSLHRHVEHMHRGGFGVIMEMGPGSPEWVPGNVYEYLQRPPASRVGSRGLGTA